MMNIEMFGRGHSQGGMKPKRNRLLLRDRKMRVGVFRRGGLGDGLLETAAITGVARHLPNAEITGYADDSFYQLLLNHPKCSSVQHVPWTADLITEIHVRNAKMIEDDQEVWFDVKPIPFVDGKRSGSVVAGHVLDELRDIEGRYYHFNGDEIIEFYERHGAHGQPDLLSRLFGFECGIEDAVVPTKEVSLPLPEQYATISVGWTDTSHYKAWTKEGWAEAARWLSEHGVCPIQIGLESEEHIPGTMSVQHLPFYEQVAVVKEAMFCAGSDGFFSHVASAMGVPAVVLWGFTPWQVWGHPTQTNVVSPDFRNIWWTSFHWAADDACTDIMAKIQKEQVTEAFEGVLNGGG